MSNATKSERQYTLALAARLTGLRPAGVRHYVRVGLVTPLGVERGSPVFGDPALARLRRIRRLRADLGVNMAGIEVAMRLLDQLAALRATLDRERGRGRAKTSGHSE